MSLKDIVIAVLVLYITYKLVDGTGVEPVIPVRKVCTDYLEYYHPYKMSSLMTCSGRDGRIVYGHIQVGIKGIQPALT